MDLPILTAAALAQDTTLLERGSSHVALLAPPAVADEAGIRLLAERMAECGALVGLGVLRLADGRLHPPPARLEDLRFRDPPGLAVVVISRPHLRAVLAASPLDPADPVPHWRLLRDCVAAGRVLTTNLTLASRPAGPAHEAVRRIPIDLAGPRFEPVPRDDLILLYGEVDASVSLYFDGIPLPARQRLRVLHPAGPAHDLPHLLAASLVVIVRGFEFPDQDGTLDLMDRMGVPYAWFVDDNIPKLAEDQAGFAYYSSERVAAFAARICGVIASTPALAAAMRVFGRPVLEWPCVFDDTLAASPARRGTDLPVLGAVGGSFRRRSLDEHILPALHDADPAGRMTLHARFDLVRGLDDARLRPVPAEMSLRQFVHAWKDLGCDLLLHPAGEAANMPYKSPATLLVSRYLGAVPIVGDEPAYAGLGPAQGVGVASSSPASWATLLREFCDPALRARLQARLDTWCRGAFAPEAAAARLTVLSGWAVQATVLERDRRLRRALPLPSVDHAAPDTAPQSPAPLPPVQPVPEPPRPPLALQLRWRALRVARWVATRTGTLDEARRLRNRLRRRRSAAPS